MDLLRCVWIDQAKTLVLALGEQGIHVETPLPGGTLSLWYEAGLRQRALSAGTSYEARFAEESANILLRRCSTPEKVAVAVKGLLSLYPDHKWR